LTVGEIQEALRLTESALRSVQEAEKYAATIISGDRSGYAAHAYTKAKQAVQDLERLKRHLRAARPA
jgi:hypothetical protein